MNWSPIGSWAWSRGNKAPARRTPSSARLAVESLEDRLVPSTTSDVAYQLWQQQTFQVDDVAVAAAAVPTNASFGGLIGLPSAFTNTPYRGTGYSVAVIDTGIDYTHTSLGAGFGAGKRVIAGWDFVNNDANPMDDNGHGTHVAGIIGSSSATYSGVAPNVNLIALKVLSSTGSGTFGNVEKALQWVAANRAAYNIVAINLSLGAGNYTSNPYTFLEDEFSTLKNNGVFLSVAAGNSFYSYNSVVGLDYPAISPQVVSVGAVYDGNFGSVAWASGARDFTTAADRVASFSQRGPALSIMAPGAMITSTYLNNTTKSMAGTSMAAPVVAGAAVLIHQAMDARQLTANQNTILALMKQTGASVIDGDDENDNVTNTGLTYKRLDVGAALAALGQPANAAPVLQAIPNQVVAPGGSFQVVLNATDPEGRPITYSASVQASLAAQAYQLKQQFGLKYMGSYYPNLFGQKEKWISSTAGTWYGILPNGQLRKWVGSMASTLQPANLIATLNADYYANPSLLWNAAPVTATTPTVSVNGNQLTVQAPASASGAYQIQVAASDGTLSSTQTFTVTVRANTAPRISALAAQAMFNGRARTITLNATDAQNDKITFSARVLGTFASAPASLVVVGNKLTIHTAPDYVGAFDVQITASDGSLSSAGTMRVTVGASSVAFRAAGDFNGDRVQDRALLLQDGSVWVSLNKADGSFVNQFWAYWSAASNWSAVVSGDFNGDGKSDLAALNKSGSVKVATSAGTRFNDAVWTLWAPASNWKLFQAGDFNGDGKTDILGFTNFGSVWIGTSTGAAFTTKFATQWSAGKNWASLAVADVNADGKFDLAGRNANGNWYVAYASTAGFTTRLWTSATPPVAG